jgi:hypothetical protein
LSWQKLHIPFSQLQTPKLNNMLQQNAVEDLSRFDAHAKPPQTIKAIYKRLQKLAHDSLDGHSDIIDLDRPNAQPSSFLDLPCGLREAFSSFLEAYDTESSNCMPESRSPGPGNTYKVDKVPGE